MEKRFHFEAIIGLMILISLSLITWQRFGMNKVYRIDDKTSLEVVATSDTANGGASFSEYKHTPNSHMLAYKLIEKTPYPFSSLTFIVPIEERGIDLSDYPKVAINAKFIGEGSSQFRFHVRNYNPKIRKDTSDVLYYKFNEISFDVDSNYREQLFLQEDFRVPGWWIEELQISKEHSKVKLDRIHKFEIVTGEKNSTGSGLLQVSYIEFRGKLISEKNLFQVLLYSWMLFFLIHLIIQIGKMQKQLKIKTASEKELTALNEVLQIEKEELKEQATHDPLTGALNRAGMRSRLHNHIRAYKKSRIELSLILFDIDHFKIVNDTKGHPEGDRILIGLVDLVQKRLREGDDVVRWGGEEFVLLCPKTNSQQATGLAESIRMQIENCNLEITCSFGVSSYRGQPLSSLFQEVDEALYKAKEGGRNQVKTTYKTS